MDVNLTHRNDQLLAEIRNKALEDPSGFANNDNYLKSLFYCMLSQWLNERDDE